MHYNIEIENYYSYPTTIKLKNSTATSEIPHISVIRNLKVSFKNQNSLPKNLEQNSFPKT